MLTISVPDAIVLGSAIVAAAILIGALIVARRLTAQMAAPMFPFPSAPLPPEAMPTESSGAPVTDDTRLERGMTVLALWNGTWWNAEVVSLERDRQVRIHYKGWDVSWDEVVPRSRLQLDLRDSLKDDERE